MIGRSIDCVIFFQNTDDCSCSEESFTKERTCNTSVADGPEDDTRSPDSISRSSKSAFPSLVESCVDIRTLNIQDTNAEHDVDATIISLESQLGHLCCLFDELRLEFQRQLRAFRKDTRQLPERVGVANLSRQHAHILRIHGKSIAESGELALHKLRYHLAHLISLGDHARPYGECHSAESSPASSGILLDSTDNVPSQKSDVPQPQVSLARSPTSSVLAQASSDHPDSSATGAASDDHTERSPDYGQVQHATAEMENTTSRPRREWIIDWGRFCGDCPARTDPSHCSHCRGWRRGFEDPTWNGIDW